MPTPSDAPGSAFPNDPREADELTGGADAAEKTTYVLGEGTEPETRRAPGDVAPALGGPSSSVRTWVAALVLLVIGGFVYFLAR